MKIKYCNALCVADLSDLHATYKDHRPDVAHTAHYCNEVGVPIDHIHKCMYCDLSWKCSLRRKGKMPTYEVNLTNTTRGSITVEANTEDELDEAVEEYLASHVDEPDEGVDVDSEDGWTVDDWTEV